MSAVIASDWPAALFVLSGMAVAFVLLSDLFEGGKHRRRGWRA